MNSGRHQLKSFLANHNLDQIIVPEIQRDYVWGEENVLNLLESIMLNSEKQNELEHAVTEEQLNSLSPQAREILARGLEKNKSYCNIGFIYAYFDSELPGRFILIDGQQRMTTLFLLLLSVCVKENKKDHFKRHYVKDGSLKFDYKVRQDAHDFLINFVNHILDDFEADDVVDQYWYYQDYKNDSTINAILNNYKTINSYVIKHNIALDYIEENIEFWYFDTNKSKQGEELYIYMNSRGESVNSSESIKANLLKSLTEQEKHDWGANWEKWQNFFWKNKGLNLNGDKGLELFLKCIKIIECIKENSNNNTLAWQIDKIREIRESKKFTSESLSFIKIEKYIDALYTLSKYKADVKLKDEWLQGKIEAIDYIRLLPILMYAQKYPDSSLLDVKRFSRFFFNITKLDNISKNPYPFTIAVVQLVKLFLDKSYYDVAEFTTLSSHGFETILTEEEIIKFTIYKESSNSIKRVEIEKAFWEAEDHKYCEGKISIIWDYMDYRPSLESIGSFSLELFKEYFSNFKLIFTKPDDLLRRALLTKGDYSSYDGRTSSLGGDRYSYIAEDWRWRLQLVNKPLIFKSLIKDFISRNRVTELNRNDILQQIINDYLASNHEIDTDYLIISHKSILNYCRQKFICYSDSGQVYLLQDKNAVTFNYEELEEYLKDQ